jgi:hypothetical protein
MSSPTTDPLDDGLRAAVKLVDDGRYQEGAQVLESLLRNPVERRSRLATVHAKLGGIYLGKLRLPNLAERHFRRACELSPPPN